MKCAVTPFMIVFHSVLDEHQESCQPLFQSQERSTKRLDIKEQFMKRNPKAPSLVVRVTGWSGQCSHFFHLEHQFSQSDHDRLLGVRMDWRLSEGSFAWGTFALLRNTASGADHQKWEEVRENPRFSSGSGLNWGLKQLSWVIQPNTACYSMNICEPRFHVPCSPTISVSHVMDHAVVWADVYYYCTILRRELIHQGIFWCSV